MRPQRREVSLPPENEPADRHPLRLPHGIDQQAEGALVIAFRDRIVADVVVDRVNRGAVHELLDVDGATSFGSELLELAAVNRDVTILGHLETLQDVGGRHRLAGGCRRPAGRERSRLGENHTARLRHDGRFHRAR